MTRSYKDWLDLDVENIEPMNLSDSKKAKIKNNILAKSHRKKKFLRLRHLTAAAIIGISTVAAISFTFPTVASQIPFIQNIMSFFQNEADIDLEKYATAIGQVQTDNGISVMIEDAVYDGTSITVSYALETDIDLGERPYMSNLFNVEESKRLSMTGRGSLQKTSDTTYVGLARIIPEFKSGAQNEVVVSWEPHGFITHETKTEYKGDWQFEFKLAKLESKVQLVNKSITQDGVKVLIKSLETNDMSTVIHYEQFVEADILKKWPYVTAQFNTVQDDLGNTYIVDGNGSRSTDDGLSYQSSGAIKSIDPNAKSLKFVPTIYFSLGSGKGVETKEMDPIIIDLQ